MADVNVAGVANTLADCISRWDCPSISTNLRRFRPDVRWREQVVGQAGVDLCSGMLAASTSTRQLHDHFDGPTRAVFGRLPFCSLTGAPRYLQVEESESNRIEGLIAFAAWCCSSDRSQVGTISGKLTAVQFFHRRVAGLELPISSSLIKRTLRA